MPSMALKKAVAAVSMSLMNIEYGLKMAEMFGGEPQWYFDFESRGATT